MGNVVKEGSPNSYRYTRPTMIPCRGAYSRIPTLGSRMEPRACQDSMILGSSADGESFLESKI